MEKAGEWSNEIGGSCWWTLVGTVTAGYLAVRACLREVGGSGGRQSLTDTVYIVMLFSSVFSIWGVNAAHGSQSNTLCEGQSFKDHVLPLTMTLFCVDQYLIIIAKIYWMPDNVPTTLSLYSILLKARWGKYLNYPHFTDKLKHKIKHLLQDHSLV